MPPGGSSVRGRSRELSTRGRRLRRAGWCPPRAGALLRGISARRCARRAWATGRGGLAPRRGESPGGPQTRPGRWNWGRPHRRCWRWVRGWRLWSPGPRRTSPWACRPKTTSFRSSSGGGAPAWLGCPPPQRWSRAGALHRPAACRPGRGRRSEPRRSPALRPRLSPLLPTRAPPLHSRFWTLPSRRWARGLGSCPASAKCESRCRCGEGRRRQRSSSSRGATCGPSQAPGCSLLMKWAHWATSVRLSSRSSRPPGRPPPRASPPSQPATRVPASQLQQWTPP